MTTMVLLCSGISSYASAFVEGQHYDKVVIAPNKLELLNQHLNLTPDKVQVMEFFSYGCYWCSQVHNPVKVWAEDKKNEIAMFQYPVLFNRVWRELGKLYYVANDLANDAKNNHNADMDMDNIIFEAIHIRGMRAWQPSVMQTLLHKTAGINEDKFNNYYNSDRVEKKLDFAYELADAFNVDATPLIVVHGKAGSYATNLIKTTNKETLIEVIDYLVKMQR